MHGTPPPEPVNDFLYVRCIHVNRAQVSICFSNEPPCVRLSVHTPFCTCGKVAIRLCLGRVSHVDHNDRRRSSIISVVRLLSPVLDIKVFAPRVLARLAESGCSRVEICADVVLVYARALVAVLAYGACVDVVLYVLGVVYPLTVGPVFADVAVPAEVVWGLICADKRRSFARGDERVAEYPCVVLVQKVWACGTVFAGHLIVTEHCFVLRVVYLGAREACAAGRVVNERIEVVSICRSALSALFAFRRVDKAFTVDLICVVIAALTPLGALEHVTEEDAVGGVGVFTRRAFLALRGMCEGLAVLGVLPLKALTAGRADLSSAVSARTASVPRRDCCPGDRDSGEDVRGLYNDATLAGLVGEEHLCKRLDDSGVVYGKENSVKIAGVLGEDSLEHSSDLFRRVAVVATPEGAEDKNVDASFCAGGEEELDLVAGLHEHRVVKGAVAAHIVCCERHDVNGKARHLGNYGVPLENAFSEHSDVLCVDHLTLCKRVKAAVSVERLADVCGAEQGLLLGHLAFVDVAAWPVGVCETEACDALLLRALTAQLDNGAHNIDVCDVHSCFRIVGCAPNGGNAVEL